MSFSCCGIGNLSCLTCFRKKTQSLAYRIYTCKKLQQFPNVLIAYMNNLVFISKLKINNSHWNL